MLFRVLHKCYDFNHSSVLSKNYEVILKLCNKTLLIIWIKLIGNWFKHKATIHRNKLLALKYTDY